MQAPYGFMVLLGFFSLAGILINNGNVLVDRIQAEEKAGRDPLEAVITACLARLRPILMTTLTTVSYQRAVIETHIDRFGRASRAANGTSTTAQRAPTRKPSESVYMSLYHRTLV